jgi:hypothetical protein
MASNVVEHLTKLQKRLDEKGRFYVYHRDKKKKEYVLLVKENTWKDAEKALTKKLKKFKKLPKYVLVTVIEIDISDINVTPEDKSLVNGPLRVTVSAHRIKENLTPKLVIYDMRKQNIWYTKEELSNRKFSFTDLIKIVDVVNKKKVNMDPFVPVTISNVLCFSKSKSK